MTLGSFLLTAVTFIRPSLHMSRLTFVYFVSFSAIFVFLIRMIYDMLFQTRILDEKALVVGTGPLACEIVNIIKTTPHSGIEVLGLISETEESQEKEKAGIPILGSASRLLSLIHWYKTDLVILAMEAKQKISESEVMYSLMKQPLKVVSAIRLFENMAEAIPYHILGDQYLLGLMGEVRTRNYLKIKRILDIFSAILLLIITAPILLLAMFLLSFGGFNNIFFNQKRIGLDGKPFELFKLRTMTIAPEPEKKIFRLGKWLRKFRVDELPQLFNVLNGSMSLVGPRPETPYFVKKCHDRIPFYSVIYTVKPGLTGWAQVKFRHTTSDADYDLKFCYNAYYLKNLSLTLDFNIILKTIRTVLTGSGK